MPEDDAANEVPPVLIDQVSAIEVSEIEVSAILEPESTQKAYGSLALLACVDHCPSGQYSQIYDHLAATLSSLEKQAFILKGGSLDPELAAMAGPFVARAIIEATCTALIGRFDPFRVLMIREKQLLVDYDYSERSAIAMNWNADFHVDSKNASPINLETRIDSIPRSLFGKYYEKALWIEAVEKFADAHKFPRSDWMIELNRVVPSQFIPNIRQDVQRLYSRCSKAIHQEFVVKNADYADPRFINEQLGQSLELMSKLSVIFNCSPHVLRPRKQEELFEAFQDLNDRWLA